MTLLILTSECKQPGSLFEIHKSVFDVTKYKQNGAKLPVTANHQYVCNIYKTVYLQNKIYFGILMLTSSTGLLVLVVTEGFF